MVRQFLLSDKLIEYYTEKYGGDAIIHNKSSDGRSRVYSGPFMEDRDCIWLFPHTSRSRKSSDVYLPLKVGGIRIGQLTPVAKVLLKSHVKHITRGMFKKDPNYRKLLSLQLRLLQEKFNELRKRAKKIRSFTEPERDYIMDNLGECNLYDFKKLEEIAISATPEMLKSKTSDVHVLRRL